MRFPARDGHRFLFICQKEKNHRHKEVFLLSSSLSGELGFGTSKNIFSAEIHACGSQLNGLEIQDIK